MTKRTKTIGVFDSGFGGLAILKDIVKQLPQYHYRYLGDTARSPYGSRPSETVLKFTKQAIDFLFKEDCELIIVACNTASAEALSEIQQHYLPKKHPNGKRVLGVIVPTIEHVAELPGVERIGLLATEATVASNAFGRELKKIALHGRLYSVAAPLLVPLVEAGERDAFVRDTILRRYLAPLLKKRIDTLILGCTHYGHLEKPIRKILGNKIRITNEGPVVAKKLEEYLFRHPEIESRLSKTRRADFFTTDKSERFDRLGKIFYGKKILSKIAHLE